MIRRRDCGRGFAMSEKKPDFRSLFEDDLPRRPAWYDYALGHLPRQILVTIGTLFAFVLLLLLAGFVLRALS